MSRRDTYRSAVGRRVTSAFEMTASQAQAEARELRRLATDELSALPRGIGDIHARDLRARVRRARPVGAPVRA